MTLSLKRLKHLLCYNPDTGLFIRRVRVANQAAGKVAGSCERYCNIAIDGEYYAAHRLAFFYMTGEWPKGEVDHINGSILDNRWSNLRDGDRSQNQHNRPKQKNNSSGYKGVTWSKFANKWCAVISINRVKHHIGYFDAAIEAHNAYELMANSLVQTRERAA